jgi:hypothetical protein
VKNAYDVIVRNPEGRNHLEDVVVDGRILLTWLLSKWSVRKWIAFIQFRI